MSRAHRSPDPPGPGRSPSRRRSAGRRRLPASWPSRTARCCRPPRHGATGSAPGSPVPAGCCRHGQSPAAAVRYRTPPWTRQHQVIRQPLVAQIAIATRTSPAWSAAPSRDVTPVRIGLAPVALRRRGCGVEQQKAVVRGEHEPPDAGVPEQPPGRPQPLHHVVEDRRADAPFPRHRRFPGYTTTSRARATACFRLVASRVSTSSRLSHGHVPPPTRSCIAALRSSDRRLETRPSRIPRPSRPMTAAAAHWPRRCQHVHAHFGHRWQLGEACSRWCVAGVSPSSRNSSSPISSKRSASMTK